MQLDALLDFASYLLDTEARPKRLVFLGDLINRGPDTIGALKRWAMTEPLKGAARVERLMGNHEQLLRIAIGRGPEAKAAWEMSLAMGACQFVAELRSVTEQPTAAISRDLLQLGIGQDPVDLLRDGLRPFVYVGNVVLVHAGLDPTSDESEFLALSADALPRADHHWAWIDKSFLTWRGGFRGRLVVHGHTPPDLYRFLTGTPNTFRFDGDRLCLDGGSAGTGTVVAGQLEDGRYRILRASMPMQRGSPAS